MKIARIGVGAVFKDSPEFCFAEHALVGKKAVLFHMQVVRKMSWAAGVLWVGAGIKAPDFATFYEIFSCKINVVPGTLPCKAKAQISDKQTVRHNDDTDLMGTFVSAGLSVQTVDQRSVSAVIEVFDLDRIREILSIRSVGIHPSCLPQLEDDKHPEPAFDSWTSFAEVAHDPEDRKGEKCHIPSFESVGFKQDRESQGDPQQQQNSVGGQPRTTCEKILTFPHSLHKPEQSSRPENKGQQAIEPT